MEDDILEFNAITLFKRYYNEDSTWGCYNFSTEDDIPFYKCTPDGKKTSSLVGKMQELSIGCEYLVKAKYKKDKVYGDQYEPISVYALLPQTKEQQILFLKSLIPESIAENLINAYPNVVNDVVNGTLDTIDYSKVRGVREATWRKIKDKIINNYLVSDIIIMLKPIGVTYAMIKKLLSEVPNPMLLKKEINENPYTLCRINGLGFKKIDDFALKLNPDKIDSKERMIAYVKYFFTEMGENEGHTWCSIDILKSAIINNVLECKEHFEWLLTNNDFLHVENEKIGLKYYYDVEMKIMGIISHKIHKQSNVDLIDKNIEIGIEKAQENQGFQYTEEQLKVINDTISRNISFITGRAGTGKSSVYRAIINIFKEHNYNISASALSAMAAQRITEASDYPAHTIHRTLGCQGINKFQFNKDNKLVSDVVFLDEGSMVNARLFLDWLEAIDDNTQIIISGDYRQLPPIGYGNIFSDLIEVFKKSVVSELTKPMRQAEKSGILVDANLICDNKNPIKEPSAKVVHGELQDMYYMFRDNRQSLFNIAINTFLKSVKTDGVDNVVIAVPRRKDCLNCTLELNKAIQDKLLCDEKKHIDGFENSFKLGAKVMQTVNDYDNNVFNGEIGYITEINKRQNGNKQEEYCIVTYKNICNGMDKSIEYTKKDLKNLDLAYAMTVHKLQGSGKKTVIGIIDNTHYQLLDSCMLYTLLTRAKKRCLLLAEPQAFLKCIRTNKNRRNTWISNN